ncbi:MAG: hypothetical protein ACRCW2_08520 [Cellulosilyticaceae bacterium]
MIGVRCRWLQRDARRVILKADKAINGKLEMNTIKELVLEVGQMMGRIEERIKDLKQEPKPVYGELLRELEKRYCRLWEFIEMQNNKPSKLRNTNFIVRCPYQRTLEQEKELVKR